MIKKIHKWFIKLNITNDIDVDKFYIHILKIYFGDYLPGMLKEESVDAD